MPALTGINVLNINELHPLPAYSQDTINQPAIKHYLSYYHLNFLDQQLCSDQAFGVMPLGNYQIAVHSFYVAKPKATVIFIHGYMDHVGSHRSLIQYFLEQSFNVIAFDLPGHGLSSGTSASIPSFIEYHKVLSDLTAQINQWGIPHPRYLVGHSTGASVAIQFVQSTDFPNYDKLILLAPLVEPTGWTWIQVQLFFMKHFKATIKRRFIQNTSDDAFWLFLRMKDPLQAQVISTDWLLAVQSWLKDGFMPARPLDIPVLMIQGEKDIAVNGKKNRSLLEGKFNNFTYVEIEGARHHLSGESAHFRNKMTTAMDNFLKDSTL